MATASLDMKGGLKMQGFFATLAARIVKGPVVRMGYLQDAKYPDGTSVAQVAFWQEFGTIRAQARPTFKPMIAAKAPGWGPLLGKQLKANGYNVKAALAVVGQAMTDELVESIVKTPVAPLSPITLMLRKMKDDDPTLIVTGRTVAIAAARVAQGLPGATGTRAKPLVDTNVMKRAPNFKVS